MHSSFRILDPAQPGGLRGIDPARTHRAFAQVFPGLPITELMGRILGDETYQKWQQIRNVLAHRVATAGRTVQHGDSSFSGLLSL